MKTNKILRLSEWIIKRKWYLLFSSILLSIAIGFGAQFLTFSNDYHIYFDEDNTQVLAFDALQEKYTKDDNAFIVIEPKNGNVFSKDALKAISDLEKRSWQVPFSTRVDAVTNFQHTRAVGDDMYVESLGENIDSKSDSAIAYIKNVAINEPLLLNRLVNKEGSLTAVNVTVNLPADDMNAPLDVMIYVKEMVAEWNKKYPEYNTYISGIVLLNGSFAEYSMSDMMSIVPLMFLIILIAVFITTRSLSSMLTSLLVLFLSIIAAMGVAGFMGVQLTGPSASAPTMIMTLAIADSIHLLITILQNMRNGSSKHDAIKESLRVNFMPVLITSVTTIIGFLTLNFVEGEPFHDLGNITSIGVAAAFLFSVFMLPALVAILPFKVKVKPTEKQSNPVLNALAELVIKRRVVLLIGSIIVVVLVSTMSVKNELNNRFVEFFDKEVPFRSETDYISENLTGIYNIEYSLGTGVADGITDPSYLHHLDEFEKWYKSQPEVVHVSSFSEIMKRVNRSMHGDKQSFYTIPKTKEESSQFLLLYEMSLPYGLDLNNQINVDKSETRFTVTLKNISSKEMMELTARAEDWLRENAPKEMFNYGISTALMFSHITKNNMDSMISSGLIALIIISLILVVVLKSFKYGLISLIPNITPIAFSFGIWFFLVGQINMAVAVVLGMTLGIVVDDTIHLLSKYIRARRELNKSPEDAIRYAFSTVGQAVLVTTVILAAGFSILVQSSFGFNADMGKINSNYNYSCTDY